jgi:AraC-like DNA-binding protein
MKAAIDLVVRQDADLTQAAHAAGFYDSAHFSRCFKEWFGIKPSAVYNNSRIVQAGV